MKKSPYLITLFTFWPNWSIHSSFPLNKRQNTFPYTFHKSATAYCSDTLRGYGCHILMLLMISLNQTLSTMNVQCTTSIILTTKNREHKFEFIGHDLKFTQSQNWTHGIKYLQTWFHFDLLRVKDFRA